MNDKKKNIKTITLKSVIDSPGLYTCSEPGDQSGEWVKAGLARELYDALLVAYAEIERLPWLRPQKVSDQIEAALAKAVKEA